MVIRVLHIMGAAVIGGVSTVILNYYRHLDCSKIHFDIAATDIYIGRNARMLEQMGCNIFPLPLKSEKPWGYCKALRGVMRTGGYDAVHVHCKDTSFLALAIAREVGIKCRIVHAHSANFGYQESWLGRLKHSLCKLLNDCYSTNLMACGKYAGECSFGKRLMRKPKSMIIPNAIDTEAFKFDPIIRGEKRKILGLTGKFALGIIGRISPEKNVGQGLRIFLSIRKQIPNACLVIVGSGREEERVRKEARELGLTDCVQFLGQRNDISEIDQALDMLLLPSVFEGFPVTVLEAMASGLPCMISDTVTRELDFGTAIKYLPTANTEVWGEAALAFVNEDENARLARCAEVKTNGYDIIDAAKSLERFYIDVCGEKMKILFSTLARNKVN